MKRHWATRVSVVGAALQRADDRAAVRVAEHDDQRRAELRRRELDAAECDGEHDVAGDPDDEQVAELLVEHDLDRHARVGAAEDDGKRLLLDVGLRTAHPPQEQLAGVDLRGEALVAFAQAAQRLVSTDHQPCLSLSCTGGVA